MHALTGPFLVILSAVAFGFIGLFGRWAKADGLPIPTMLFLRFSIASLLLGLLVVVRREPLPRGGALAGLAAMGAVFYAGQASFYFAALDHAPIGIVALLLYLFPAIVAILSRLFLKERLTPARLTALLLALTGTALTVWPALSAGTGRRAEPLGILLGLGAAVVYALYILAGARFGRGVGAFSASLVVSFSAALSFGAVSLLRADPFPQTGRAWAAVLCLAVVCTFVAITALLAGLQRVGAVRASTLSTFEPITAVLVGAVAFGEAFALVQLAGGALILAAAVLAARPPESPAAAPDTPAA